MRRRRDRDLRGGLSCAAPCRRSKQPREEPPVTNGGHPSAQGDPAPDRGGTDDAPRARDAADVRLGQPRDPEEGQRPGDGTQGVEPARRRLSRNHRHHGAARLALVAADAQDHQGRLRAWAQGAAELTVPQPMSLQSLGLPRGTTGCGTGWASPRADRLHARRRLQPTLDVQLASNDRSCGSTSGHGDSASRGAADRRGAANVPPVTYFWTSLLAPRTPDRSDRLSRHGLRLNRHANDGHPRLAAAAPAIQSGRDPARARHQERPLTLRRAGQHTGVRHCFGSGSLPARRQ